MIPREILKNPADRDSHESHRDRNASGRSEHKGRSFPMIPREILKKIRQIELRSNRLVTASADGGCVRRTSRSTPEFSNAPTNHHALRLGLRPQPRSKGESFQPLPQFSWIPCAVPDGANDHFRSFPLDGEINRILPRFRHFGSAGQTAGKRKSFRILANGFEKVTQLLGESLPHSRLPLVVETNRLGKFPFRLLFNDNPKTHHLARNRFSMSATTSSSGRQRSGCAKARSARRSSSAICSGVSLPSKYSSRTFSATSYCSANGKRWICSMICVALMAAIYSFDFHAQAEFFPSRITHHASRHP